MQWHNGPKDQIFPDETTYSHNLLDSKLVHYNIFIDIDKDLTIIICNIIMLEIILNNDFDSRNPQR